jgi:nitroreductase
MEAILTRRSVRRYTDEAVPDTLVTDLLRAAMAAPSAQNQQPWQFVVVRDRRLLEGLAAANPYAGMTRDAQLAIAVCGDLTREKSPGFWVQDCAAATQNILVAANAAGLGAVWTGTFPREERVAKVKEVLGLPEHIVPLAVVPIGYPAEHPPPAERFDPARVHLDHW